MITDEKIAEVKRHLKYKWNDSIWHDYNNLLETQAIAYALASMAREWPDSPPSWAIKDVADAYLKATQND